MRFTSLLNYLATAAMGVNAAAIGSASPVDPSLSVVERESGAKEPATSLVERQDGIPPFDQWTCGVPTGGGGHQALRNVHGGFNRVFGDPRLTMAAGQCYVANCYGHHFAVCNTSGITRTEIANHRNIAKDSDPGQGGSCRYLVWRESYIHYYFGVGDGSFGPRADRRRC